MNVKHDKNIKLRSDIDIIRKDINCLEEVCEDMTNEMAEQKRNVSTVNKLRRQAGDARQKALEDLNRLVDQADTEKATMDTQLD